MLQGRADALRRPAGGAPRRGYWRPTLPTAGRAEPTPVVSWPADTDWTADVVD
jgi:hypothetical protein